MGMRIVATGFAVPPHIQTAEQLAPLIGRTRDWIVEHTGVVNRHVAAGDYRPEVLAAQAAWPIIDEFGTPDLIMNAGAIQRQLIPDTSCFIQRELGLSGIASFTVNATCLSFLTALQVANSFINDRVYRRILICSSELATRGRDFGEPESAALMGDGAAAVLVEASESDSGIEHFAMATWPSGVDLAEVRGGGVHQFPDGPTTQPADHLFHMQGEQLLRSTIPKLKRFLRDFYADADVQASDFDLVVPHQPSGPALRLLPKIGFDEDRIVNILADYGNCVAASMPMALAIANRDNRLARGDRVLLLGTAAGISIGAALLRW